VNKEAFDKKVAAIWQLFEATQTLNNNGIGARVQTESVQYVLRTKAAEIGEALADGLAAPVGK
jgi:hypothetical protein